MVHSVSRFEANLLSIVYAIAGERSPGQMLLKVVQPIERPRCLSRETVALVEQALAKGTSLWLARAGGWRVERFLRSEKPVSGRVWQRTPPSELGLKFSRSSLDFLIWLTAKEPLAPNCRWQTPPEELTVGDQILFFRTLSALYSTPVATKWLAERFFINQPLVSLFFLDDIAAEVGVPNIDYRAWVQGEGAVVLECLQTELAKRWVRMERAKCQVQSPERMTHLGLLQQQVLDALAKACEEYGRRDLCRFLLVALAELATPTAEARDWIRALNVAGLRLADRTTLYANASTFLAFARQLRSWTDACAATGYFDEGYAAAQLWLADWERYDGEGATQRALAMVKSLSF